uniref:Uncharacterized protein n=1 Tax=Pyxicephalus adspersus TaxID=30357 RepID=A0AAV3B0Q9_PYXAD|nr:TPA: hypothetical protein GDO54_008551 [Pyxicephalus adspersus]
MPSLKITEDVLTSQALSCQLYSRITLTEYFSTEGIKSKTVQKPVSELLSLSSLYGYESGWHRCSFWISRVNELMEEVAQFLTWKLSNH